MEAAIDSIQSKLEKTTKYQIEDVLVSVDQQTQGLFFFNSYDGVRLSTLGTSATIRPIVPASDEIQVTFRFRLCLTKFTRFQKNEEL
jgi:hypothetical protein